MQLEAASCAKLWEVCRAEGLSVVADMHTRPAGPGQSSSDRTNPMVALRGHVALIVPRFATGNPRPRSLGLYVYEGSHRLAPHPLEARPHLVQSANLGDEVVTFLATSSKVSSRSIGR